jgi:hypothetical protein
MDMCVVGVMFVFLGVLNRLVHVFVFVPFAQMQPHARRHQTTRHQQRGGDGLAQPHHRQRGTEEGRDGEVRGRVRRAQALQRGAMDAKGIGVKFLQ